MSGKKIVFIICSGVGHINRGYESFATELNEAIRGTTSFETILLKGRGEDIDNEKSLWCIKRTSNLGKLVGKLLGKDSYWLEQFTFSLSILLYAIKNKPDVIVYWDFHLGTFLWHFRRFLKFKYKLLFSNGAPNGPPFIRMNHVQQHLPTHFNVGIDGGTPIKKQTLLTAGIKISIAENKKLLEEKILFRQKLLLPLDKKIIITVGTINKNHKRIDYVIDELSQMPDDFFLVVLGQISNDTNEIIAEAENKIKGRFIIKNVPKEAVNNFYIASDFFVLASFSEGLPRVLPEALSFGLPCFVHDYAVTRETLLQYGHYIDAAKRGALAKAIIDFDSTVHKLPSAEIIQYAYNTYSWDILANSYIQMILKVSAE